MNNLKHLLKVCKLTLLTMILFCSCSDKETKNYDNDTTQNRPNIDIHTAVVSNNIEAIKNHISAKSDINIKDPMGGSSPLISASLFGKTEIAKLLIAAGADLNIKNNDGSTALITASFFCRPDIVKLLLEKGADKTIQNNFKNTAYESVMGPFNEVKNIYVMMEKMLGPMGLKLDLEYIEKTRPIIAEMLK